MPEITQNQTPVHKPHRRKKNKNKESHNAVERHRKEKINAGINRIGDLIPCSPALKQSINMILGQAHKYITELKQQNDEMLLQGGDKVQAEEIKRLRRQVEDLRRESAHYLELLKANGINFLDDATIHWKGKQRSAKVAKVTPTHLLTKGIIVYSERNGNTVSPSAKQSGPQQLVPQQDKQPEPAVIVERACNVRPVIHNGAQAHNVVPSSAPQHVPVATLIPAVTRIGLTVVEQHTAVAPIAPKLPPPVNYITFQSLCPQTAVTAHLPAQPLPVAPVPTLTSTVSPSLPLPRQPVAGVTHLHQGVESRPLSLDAAVVVSQRTDVASPNQTLPSSSNLLSATGNTQTTWTTLHLAGNTVQPVCQALCTSDGSSSNSAAGPQLSVCSVGMKPSAQPTSLHIQQQAAVVPQVAIAASLPPQSPQQQPSQLQPAIVSPAQSAILPQSAMLTHPVGVSQGQSVVLPQPALGPHSQVALLSQPVAQPQPAIIPLNQPKPVLLPQTKPQPALLPQPQLAVMPHSAVLPQHQSVAPPQAQPTVLPQPSILPQPQAPIVAQPQSAVVPQAQPGLSSQQQAAVVPMLQTMQVLQVNPAGTTVTAVPAVPAPQNNNPNLVILQQAGSCTAPQVMREDLSGQTAQTPCQHIVIIQAANQTPQTAQGPQTGVVPATVPVLPSHVAVSSTHPVTKTQAVPGKQLVQLLPQLSSQAPQTISMNGQVYVLQPVKSPDKASTVSQQVGQTFSADDQSRNVTLHTLGSLTSLNQTDSQASSQSVVQVHTIVPPSHAVVQPKLATTNLAVNSSVTITPTVQENPVPHKQVKSKVKGPVKKIGPKRKPGRKPKSARSKDIKLGCLLPIAAKVTTQQAKPVDPVRPLKPSTAPAIAPKTSVTSTGTATVSSANSGQNTAVVTKKICAVMKPPVTAATFTASGVSSTSTSSSLVTAAPVSVPVSGAVATVSSIQATPDKSTVTPPVTSISSVSTIVSGPTVTSSSSTPCRTMATSVSITPKAIAVSKESAKPSRSVVTTSVCSALNISTDNGVQMTKGSSAVSCVNSIVKPTCSAVGLQPVSRESPHQSKTTVSVGLSVPSIPSTVSYSTVQATASVTCVVSAPSKSTVTPSSSVMAPPIPTVTTPVSSGPVNSGLSNQPSLQCQSKPANLLDSPQLCHASTLPAIQMSCAEPTSQSAPRDRASQVPPPEPRKRDDGISASRTQPQEVGLAPLSSTQMNSAELKLDSRKDKELVSVEKEHLVANTCPRKDSSLPQEVYTLEQDSLEQPLMSSQQTDSPLSAGGRGFSVASMLPTGHSISGSSNSFGSFSFTPEQAEILALVTAWDLPKSQQASSSKDRNTEQQFKPNKHLDLPLVKTSSQSSVRCPPVEGATSRPNNRPPHSVSYSQSQSASVGSLNVSNLIRPSSCQPYPASPSLGQQASVPSPGGPANLVSQPSTPILPNCSVSGQLNEYPPKGNLMRPHVAVGERHLKELPKRPAQDDVMLSSNKRPKGCPPGSVGRMDVKGADHSQMVIGQMTPSSSAVMTRINPESSLFSSNTFMSTVLRPTDGHCPSQVLPQEPNQPGVVHLQPGHPQHGAGPQSQQHIAGGNPYLKQHQQQEQQRHHLYQLQHHLTQSDNSQGQLHGIHQRTMQQDQHVHKKRGMVRGGQTGPPVGMQQKQHHLEKSGLQQHPPSQQQHQQHQQQQQQAHQQQQQQAHQQQQHQQQQQQQQQHQQQQHAQQHHHQPQQQQSQQLQQPQHQPPQPHQQQQQQIQQQTSHSRHQHLQQQIQQQHFGARLQDKACEAQPAGPRPHQASHLGQQECQSGQDHNAVQRLMGSRTLEQQLTSQANSAVSRSSDLTCAPSRQRLSSYSAEALIGKSSSSGDQRMGLHLQAPRGNNQDQPDLRYLDRGKGNINHNAASRLPPDHPGSTEVQRINECPPFKGLSANHQLGNFDVQASRAGDANKTGPPVQRGPQVQGTFRMGPASGGDGRSRVPYTGTHAGPQGMQIGTGLPREQEACHQTFMQSLLAPHLPEQTGHQRSTQCCPPVSLEYSCVPGTSTGDMQVKASSPSLSSSQKASAMRLGESNKGHIAQVSGNLHGQVVRTGLPHPTTPQSSAEPGRNPAPSRPLSAVSQRTRHIGQEAQSSKIRPGERPRSGTVRPSDPFESEGSLPLQGVILGRAQAGGESRRGSIVRFMPDTSQVSSENNLVPDQHLSQNFSFPFIAESSMNPPPPINANSTFIPPVSQSSTSRTPALLPVEPQNTLPSFYPSYSPAAHPSLPSDIPLQYFSNQMFTSPSTDKSSTAPLNNRFSSILSPPRAVGFAQASFPLLPEMPPMPIGNSSSITPHLPNFNLTSLFPEIATAMPPDGSSMPMSPLLSLANTSSTDSSKQSNRPAHNISHILGHDGSSAV